MLPPGVTPHRPRPGQESVWDYPRPPRVEVAHRHVVVRFGGAVLVDTGVALRVLETSHPPTWYLPRAAFPGGSLRPAEGTSFCEFKGTARYLDVVAGDRVAERAAWFYPDPAPGFEQLLDHAALYPAAMDLVTVDGVAVQPQDGGFYGGWITPDVVGPFKGGPGSHGW